MTPGLANKLVYSVRCKRSAVISRKPMKDFQVIHLCGKDKLMHP